MTYSPITVEKVKKLIGGDYVECILTGVRTGSFLQNEAEKFANHLHPEAYGAFINSKIEYGDGAMELILSSWFKKAEVFKLKREEAREKLVSALNKAGKTQIVYEIETKIQAMGSQDTTIAEVTIQLLPKNTGISPSVDHQSTLTFSGDPGVLDKNGSNELPFHSPESGKNGQFLPPDTGQSAPFHRRLEAFRQQIHGKWILGFAIIILLVNYFGMYWSGFFTAFIHSGCLTTDRPTRSIRLKKGVVYEIFKCPRNQSSIPKFSPNGSNAVDGSAVIYTKKLGILLCGGTDEGDHNAKQCYTHALDTDSWIPFEHQLNENRVDSHIRRSGNKIHIIGGESSIPYHDCYNSYETLDLDNLAAGWQKTETEILDVQTLCFQLPFLTIDDIPCNSISRLGWTGLCWAVLAVQILLDQGGRL